MGVASKIKINGDNSGILTEKLALAIKVFSEVGNYRVPSDQIN